MSQYTRDVEFNSGFGALQTPAHLYTAAAICGTQAPRIDRSFRHLDLCCGNGLTLCLLADAYPHAEFVGIDLNPAHISKARQRADAAKLTNVTFEVMDVMELAPGELGEFDFCAVSGAYAWLDAERRNHLRRYLSSAMRPGGLAYIDYSCQPGMAQVSPLYHLLQQLGNQFDGNSAERLAAAAKIAKNLAADNAHFFQINPVAAARLKTILKNPPEDEAHEVFNLQDNGLWSNAVIDEMAQAQFDYLGNAGLHHNLPALTPDANVLASLPDLPTGLLELVNDFKWNVAQRRDIYVRRANKDNRESLRNLLSGFFLYAAPASLTRIARQRLHKSFPNYNFCTDTADEFAEIAIETRTFDELFARLLERGVSIEDGENLLRHFLAARLVSLALATPGTLGYSGGLTMTSHLNENILIEDIGKEHARPFASRIVGSRVLLPLKDRLYLWALLGYDLDDAWDRLGELREIFIGRNNEKLSRESFSDVLNSSMEGFRSHMVPELIRLGILTASKQQSNQAA